MKKKLLTLLFALLPLLMNAQTIHWLTFIDTTDKNVGDVDITGRKLLYDKVINQINAALKLKGYKANIMDIYGAKVSPEKCKQLVTSLKTNPEDIVVFYYIGHGTHGTEGGDVWPMMTMAQNYASKFIPLKWVHDQLKSKNSRLTVTIGMCCNSIQDVPRLTAPTFSMNYGNTYITDQEASGLQKLFLTNKGDVLITSASVGESSGCVAHETLGWIDTFTYCLLSELPMACQVNNPNWESFCEDLQERVHNESRLPYSTSKHTPMYAINVVKAAMPTTKQPSTTTVNVKKPEQTTVSPEQDWRNIIGVGLDFATNQGLSRSVRGQQIQLLQDLFTANAIVKVMSQDGNMVVDRIPASNYFLGLISKDNLIKVTPIEIKTSGSKIQELKVKETYLKD